MLCLVLVGWVTCLFQEKNVFSSALQTSSSVRFESVEVGQDIILNCSLKDQNVMYYLWYREVFGEKPKQMSRFLWSSGTQRSLIGEFENNPRFFLDAGPGKNHMKIFNAQTSDSATYFCLRVQSYTIEFLEGIMVHVKDSGSVYQTSVHQSESGTSGNSNTLNCTVHTGICDGEHSVYWFKYAGESHSELIYTHGGRNDQCERNSSTKTQSCIYNLNISDGGTYYCAVASCGHILFGNGTKQNLKDVKESFILPIVLSAALVFGYILVAVLVCALCRIKSKAKDFPESSPAASAFHADDHRDEDDLHYAALQDAKFSRSMRDRPSQECVYSSVRQHR